MTKITGVARAVSLGKHISLPHVGADLVEFVEISVDGNLINIVSTADYSAYDGYVTLEYIR